MMWSSSISGQRPKKHLNYRDRVALDNIETKMELLHGHNDRNVMEAEMLRGVSASDLIKMNCKLCERYRLVVLQRKAMPS